MNVIKVTDRCPDITVRRAPHTSNKYVVKVNGDRATNLEGGNFCRKIYISHAHGVVVKIDKNFYNQCRNEVVFWTEILEEADKPYFAEVLGWGVTSYRSGGRSVKTFWSAQRLIDGAEEISYYDNSRKYKALSSLADKYEISDFDARQVKRDVNGDLKIHDYGLFSLDEGLESKLISPEASNARRKFVKQLESMRA